MPILTLKKIAFSFLVAGLLFFGNFQEAGARDSAADMAELLYQKAQISYYHLKSSKENRAYRHQWLACINKFITVYERYPKSPQAYNALFTVARLFHQLYGVAKNSADRDKAGHFYYKVISEFKDGRLTDDALLYQGKIFFDIKDYSAAISSFEKILLEYPQGDQALKAKKFKEAAAPFVRTAKKVKVKPSQANSFGRTAKKVEAKPSPANASILIKKVDFSRGPSATRVVVHTDGAARVLQNRLIDPERVYFNFLNARLDAGIDRDVPIGGDILKGMRLSQFDETTSRLVLDIGANQDVKIRTSRQDGKIVIDLVSPKKNSTLAAKPKAVETTKTVPVAKVFNLKAKTHKQIPHKKLPIAVKPKPTLNEVPVEVASLPEKKTDDQVSHKKLPIAVKTKPPATPKAVPVAVAPRSKKSDHRKIPLIVIDPGHGGKDLGAKGTHSLYEKNVTLDISKRLKKILETKYGYSVILTRDDDRFISLEERGQIANQKDADLFVSIHANAAKRRSAQGIETFYLGVANNDDAQETAARENGELVYSVKDNQVQQILASLISTTKKNDSAMLAGHVQDRLRKSVTRKIRGVKDRGVKEGPFFVLHDTNMPSIIVEVGFITNPDEERRLKKSKYLDRLANSIATGIHEFEKDRGPTI